LGIEIDRERFEGADYARFTERLDHCLEALEQPLERPGFGEGPRTIGAELELFLIDDQGHPLARNQAILEDAGDPRLTLELDRFNLEINPSPSPLAGQPLTSLGHELEGAIYDSGFGGHVRIEMRPLPAGPTVVDMLANAAFLLGLTLALAPGAGDWTRRLMFARAHANFYDAARVGLEAELEWPTDDGSERVGAAELVARLLPEARRGLVDAGVDAGEADRLLGVLGDRVAAGQTGAVWQRRTLAALEGGGSGGTGYEQALAGLLERYLELQAAGDPVHTWPVDG
jgi:hypothetical protein